MIKKIESDDESIKKLSPLKKKLFNKTIKEFKDSIQRLDTNLDNIDTYFHKLTEIFNCTPI